MGSQRVGHDWATEMNWTELNWYLGFSKTAKSQRPYFSTCLLLPFLASVTFTLQRKQWQSTPVLLPGKSHGWRSLVGCSCSCFFFISLGTQLLLDSHLKYEPALPKRSLMKFGGVRRRMNGSSADDLKENIRKSLFYRSPSTSLSLSSSPLLYDSHGLFPLLPVFCSFHTWILLQESFSTAYINKIIASIYCSCWLIFLCSAFLCSGPYCSAFLHPV